MNNARQPVIGLISPGAMGSAVGARLAANGARVLTSLEGRSAASAARADAAGMIDAPLADVAAADLILSIVPPAEAEATARRLLPHLSAAPRKPVYVDANALAPETKQAVGAIVAQSGAPFVDGTIIGGPPGKAPDEPTFYLAGPDAPRAELLGTLGLRIHVMAAPIGAAAALKMCYAGITKSTIGIGAAILLAASRADAAGTLHAEMRESMSGPLASLNVRIPQMYGKAYRWVAEMREIAAFLHDDPPVAMIFEGLAQLYERIAADVTGKGRERAMLDAVLRQG